jgi:MFS family permease
MNRNVVGMTTTSFLSDACYEMVLAILPGFLPLIRVSAAALGWIEGASDAFSSFLKLGAGWYSDRIGHRKRMVVAGYFFTGTGLSLFSLAHSWPIILTGRMVSWFGKGMRGSLRDAMLSESVDPAVRGKAFGFHRAGDTLGAIVGPVVGAGLIAVLPHQPPDHSFRLLFILSLIPGLAAPVAFALMVREARKKAVAKRSLWGAMGSLPWPYLRFLVGVGIFGLGDFSPTLLVLAAATLLAPRLGPVTAAQFAALLYVLRNVVYAAASYPIGALGDVRPKTRILAVGFAVGAATSTLAAVLFAKGNGSPALLALLFILSGIFAAAQDTLEGSIPPEFLPPETRGTGFGLLGAVNGAGDLVASALVGTLWTVVSPAAAFGSDDGSWSRLNLRPAHSKGGVGPWPARTGDRLTQGAKVRIIARPAKTQTIATPTDPATYIAAPAICPRSQSRAASSENAENVVNPPRIPVVRNSGSNCPPRPWKANQPAIRPIASDPVMFTNSVP